MTAEHFHKQFNLNVLGLILATQEAVKLLQQLLREPSGPTTYELALDPDWDPIRNDAGFKALLRK